MTASAPASSVIVPTHNRSIVLADCPRSLLNRDFPADGYEVIIIDDDGRVSLYTALEDFKDGLHLTLVHQAHAGPAVAQEPGAFHARING